jgi:CTP synthase (UTP-ammonia lyase)
MNTTIALVGDRSRDVPAHARIPELLDALAEREQLVLDAYWIPTTEAHEGLDGFDAIWVMPGSPYRSQEGALAAIRTAREREIPFLGSCGGFQHAILEYARNVCGITEASHAESEDSGEFVIVELSCSLVGHEAAVRVERGSLAEAALGAETTVERYNCSYGMNPLYLDVLRDHGLRFSGVDQAGEVRVMELPGHPFFLATLFQPELVGDGTRPHPLVRALATAAVDHGKVRQ